MRMIQKYFCVEGVHFKIFTYGQVQGKRQDFEYSYFV